MRQQEFSERMPVLEVAAGCIVSKMGDVTIGLELEKPEIFTMGEKEYAVLHAAFVKAIRVLPEGTVLHFQDSYRRDRWSATGRTGRGGTASGFLASASDRFFEGRPFLRHESRLYITRRPAGRDAVDSAGSSLLRRWFVPPGTLDERMQASFEDAVRQFMRVLGDSGLVTVRRIATGELVSTSRKAGLIERYCYLLDTPEPLLRDIDFSDGLRIGYLPAVLYTLADAEQLPGSCRPAVPYGPYSTERTTVFVGQLAPLGLLLDCDHIVNQYIVIGHAAETWKVLERRRLRLQSLSRYSRGNAVAAEAVSAYLQEGVSEQRLPVRVHVNVLAWTDKPDSLRELRSRVVSAMAAIDAVAREETVGAPQLWWAGIPGNAGELPVNECWDTFLEQACCFLSMETNYRGSESGFTVRVGDRLTGRPVEVDLDDEPRRRGWTQNGNLFVLSGSGGGKSFWMNHLCRTYYDGGMHVVVVDVGHSYRGLCDLLGGYYFTYEENRPLRFNPFWVSPGETVDTEKKESIKTLLMALWKRSDEVQYRSEYVALSGALQGYYDHLRTEPGPFPCFDTFYMYMKNEYAELLRRQGVTAKEFDLDNFLYVLRPYYFDGEFGYLLNAREQLDLLGARFIVFELDNVKDHPILFPVLTLVIMEVFMAKMRQLRGVRKMIVIEEAWKAIASAGMAENIRYWVKTLRKHMGKLALVSQEVEDMIDSPVIKQAILNNSDCRVLLDQGKFAGKFGEIQALLGLSEKQKAEILSINKAHGAGRPYKDLWIGLGPTVSKVYRLEVSEEEYLTYTSDQGEKVKVEEAMVKYGSRRKAVEVLAAGLRARGDSDGLR